MKLQNGYKIIYSKRDKDGVEHFYAGKGTFPSEKDDVLVMAAGNKVVYGGDKDEEVIIADGITLEDLKEITENGEYDIANFARVKVNVSGLQPTGTLNITENGEYDVTNKAGVDVNVPNPSTGTLEITANGEYDVTEKAGVNVNVPIPAGYIKPAGQKDIQANGYHNVTEYAWVNVDVKEMPAIIDFSENSYITGNISDPLSYSSFSIFGDSIGVELFSEDDTSLEISLSGVNFDCSNLEEVLYQALSDSFAVQGSILPVLATTSSIHFNAPIYAHASTWPYWQEHYEVLTEAFQNLSYMGQNTVYDISGRELGSTSLYLDTNS